MEVKRRQKRVLSHREKFLDYSGTFGAFGRIFQTSVEQDKIKAEKARAEAEKDAVLAKVCAGLSKVCKMLAGEVSHGNR